MRGHAKALIAAIAFALAPRAVNAAELAICSDPNNLPFSNRAGEGFENRIAELLARDLGMSLRYEFAAQHETFIQRTLNAHLCDVLMGVPAGLDAVAATRPYYASTYVFVYRRADRLRLGALTDSQLRTLKIGVHLIGSEPTPPELALGQEGIVDNVTGFMIYGDYAKPNPAARLIEAVETGIVDVAAVWGPLGGYFAKHSPVALTVSPMTDTGRFAPLKFHFAIAMGVRKSDTALRRKLNDVILREQSTITAILQSYGVPLVPLTGDKDD